MSYILLQVDYSGFELFVGAALSQDPKFIQDVNDTDVHARETCRIYELDCSPLEIKQLNFVFDEKEYRGGKDLRFHTKNSNVFATVYGASYLSEARELRKIECFMSFAKDKYKKANTKLDFMNWVIPWSEDHIKNWQENQFFKDYPRLKQWQNEEVKDYYINGYVSLPMGFRRYHPLDRNQIINTPTQGTAFIILLDSCIKVNKEIKKLIKTNNFKSRIILETHDDMTFRTWKPEIYELTSMVNNITLNPPFDFCKPLKLKNEWSFGRSLFDMRYVNL